MYFDLLESQRKYWSSYVDGLLSFVVKDKSDRVVGVCINDQFDFDPSEVCGGPHSVTAAASALTHFLKKQVVYDSYFNYFNFWFDVLSLRLC